MVYCGKCGSRIREGMGYCENCKEPVDPRLTKDNKVEQEQNAYRQAGQRVQVWDCSICGETGNSDTMCRACGTSSPEYARQVLEENERKHIEQEAAAKIKKEREDLIRSTYLFSIFDEHGSKVMQVRAKSKTEAIDLAQRQLGEDVKITASVRMVDRIRKRKLIAGAVGVALVAILLVVFVAVPHAEAKRILVKTSVGDVLYFGRYNGEDIAWKVLDVKDGKALLITKDCIDRQPYNDVPGDITWENCSLRKWLNNDFMHSFPFTQRSIIAQTIVINRYNPEYGTNGGNDTLDKVFLLSIDEVMEYYSNRFYWEAKINGDSTWWWLRSPGEYNTLAAVIDDRGNINNHGIIGNTRGSDKSGAGVRPALWLIIDP